MSLICLKIFYVPIEPYEERYTAQWLDLFPREFERRSIDYEVVLGKSLSSKLRPGDVLDPVGTNYYKCVQLASLCRLIKQGQIQNDDILFFADLWFPGLEMIPYIACRTKTNCRIFGVMHAGTYDTWDFTRQEGMEPWGKHLENSWLRFIDGVFIGSEYHKSILCKRRRADPRKVYVTGLPLDFDAMDIVKSEMPAKQNIVVFPHRLVPEKRPQTFISVSKRVKNADFVMTMKSPVSKLDYYKLLARSKVTFSSALQETFGIGTLEAIYLGCTPVLPNRLSYPTMYPKEYLYSDLDEAVSLVKKFLKSSIDLSELALKYKSSIPQMINIMLAGRYTE